MAQSDQFSKDEFNKIRKTKGWLLDPKEHARLWQKMKRDLINAPENRKYQRKFLRDWFLVTICPLILFLFSSKVFLNQSHLLFQGKYVPYVKLLIGIGALILVGNSWHAFSLNKAIRNSKLFNNGRNKPLNFLVTHNLGDDWAFVAELASFVLTAFAFGDVSSMCQYGWSPYCSFAVILPAVLPCLTGLMMHYHYDRSSWPRYYSQETVDANENDASNYRAKIHQYRLDHPQLTDFSDNDLLIVWTELDPFVQKVKSIQQETTDLTTVPAYLSKLSDLIDLVKNSPDNLPDYLSLIEKAQRTLELIGYYDQSLAEPDTDSVLLSQKKAEIEKLLKEKLSKLDIFIKKSNRALTQTRLENLLDQAQ